jgi:DNA-binding NarL/FixJ family response regulator
LITVAIIEDNRLVREGITALLNRFDDIQVVAAHPSGQLQLEKYNPKVLLLDLGLENGDSLDVAATVIESYPETRVIVLDLFPADEEIVEFIRAGVSGFVMKDATVDQVANTIRTVAAGKCALPPEMTRRLFSEITRDAVSRGRIGEAQEAAQMTPRELEVIGFISEGLSNKTSRSPSGWTSHRIR